MRAPVHVLCRHEPALGIALAGVTPIACETGAEADAALAALAPTPARGGVVLVERELYAALPAATLRAIKKHGAPVLMPFPGPAPLAAGAPPEHELLEILRRAIGYRMRLR